MRCKKDLNNRHKDLNKVFALKIKEFCAKKSEVDCLQEYCEQETGENFEGDHLHCPQHTWKTSLQFSIFLMITLIISDDDC